MIEGLTWLGSTATYPAYIVGCSRIAVGEMSICTSSPHLLTTRIDLVFCFVIVIFTVGVLPRARSRPRLLLRHSASKWAREAPGFLVAKRWSDSSLCLPQLPPGGLEGDGAVKEVRGKILDVAAY
jgi:hypothetical protein